MPASCVFQTVIEPSLDRVPVIEARHVEPASGRDIVISHVVRRNVFTEFDQKLSRHLAVTTGRGFPAVSMLARWRPHGGSEPWREIDRVNYPSVPHALAAIGHRALERRESCVLRLHYQDLASGERAAEGLRRRLHVDDLASFDRALAVAALFGEQPFVDMAGDFDLLALSGPGARPARATLDLVTGRVSLSGGPDGGDLGATLYDIENVLETQPGGRVYLASLRQALIAAKQEAVLDFRAAAERRILDFDAALNGRSLSGHRLEAAVSLIWRLKAGLGDTLAGLSEHAQLTAFDWEAEFRSARQGETWTTPAPREEDAARAYA